MEKQNTESDFNKVVDSVYDVGADVDSHIAVFSGTDEGAVMRCVILGNPKMGFRGFSRSIERGKGSSIAMKSLNVVRLLQRRSSLPLVEYYTTHSG